MNRRTKSDVARSPGTIQTGVTVLELDRSALQTLAREQYVLVEDEENSVLLYINGGKEELTDLFLELNPDGKCNVSIDGFGKLLRGDTVYWSGTAFNGGPLIVDSAGVNVDPEHLDNSRSDYLNKTGWD